MTKSIFGKNSKNIREDEDHWLSVSDLMAGLMIVFLFISVVLMRNATIESDKVKDIAASYQENKVQIYNALIEEFKYDLIKWDAEIDKRSLSFNFKSPEILFGIGKSTLKAKFREILNDFFPRYLTVINQYKKSIEEVRIEGHTSSIWNSFTSDDVAYFKNMNLSQNRTRSVLSYIYNLVNVKSEKTWIKGNIAAVGYSSSKLIKSNGVEDSERSRRVSFRIITNSETQILKIIGGI
ncbi:MAG TPA: OmpA family protein [Sulfurimonas autotrophica]|nr:OmpA family protein [Sulfurimonas autotrophica]